MREGRVPWPEETIRAYQERGYWTKELLGDLLAPALRRDASRPALITADRSLTYAELDAAVERRAAGLRARGLAPGDPVVVQLPNGAELVVLCLALFRTGVLPVFALPAHRTVEISHLVASSDAVAYFCADRGPDCDYREIARQVLSRTDSLENVYVLGDPGPFTGLTELDADPSDSPATATADGPRDATDVAFFLLSGGTSGPPKLIPRTHADYVHQLRLSALLCGIGPESRYLAALPIEHNFALGCPGVLGTLRAGGAVVTAPAPTPEECFPLIERARVTVTSLVPTLVPLWVEATEWSRDDLSSLQLLQVGGARLDPVTARAVAPALDCALQQVYGMAEGLLNYTRLDDPDDLVHHTQGRPLSPGDEIRLVREDGTEAAEGEAGELLTRGPYTLRGYHRAPERNRTHFTEDGFYRTGDLVRRVAGGNLEVVGRLNDVINRGGEKVPAQELEEYLLLEPGIRAASVVGLPHALLGEQTCACVVVRDGAVAPTLREVRRRLLDQGMAPYKLPDRLVVLDELPLTGVGKVDKKELRAGLAEPADRPSCSVPGGCGRVMQVSAEGS